MSKSFSPGRLPSPKRFSFAASNNCVPRANVRFPPTPDVCSRTHCGHSHQLGYTVASVPRAPSLRVWLDKSTLEKLYKQAGLSTVQMAALYGSNLPAVLKPTDEYRHTTKVAGWEQNIEGWAPRRSQTSWLMAGSVESRPKELRPAKVQIGH